MLLLVSSCGLWKTRRHYSMYTNTHKQQISEKGDIAQQYTDLLAIDRFLDLISHWFLMF